MEQLINVHNSNYIKGNINELYIQSVRNNSIEQIQWCLDSGANKNFQNDMALDTATSFENLKALKYLVNTVGLDPRNNHLCINQACQHNDIEMVQFLIEDCGVDIRSHEDRPMRNAVMRDSLETFLYLKQKGAPTDMTDMEGSYLIKDDKRKPHKTNLLTQLAWTFNSTDCMRELLDENKKVFFSDLNIRRVLSASNIQSKLDTGHDNCVNFVMKSLIEYKPEKFQKIKDLCPKYLEEKFYKWTTWLELDHRLDNKDAHIQKRKI